MDRPWVVSLVPDLRERPRKLFLLPAGPPFWLASPGWSHVLKADLEHVHLRLWASLLHFFF